MKFLPNYKFKFTELESEIVDVISKYTVQFDSCFDRKHVKAE